MPDFGAPIAQNVDVSPNKGLQTLSDLMGLQKKQIDISQAQQTLQTGVALQQQAQAEAQKQQQAMGERQLLQSSMKSGKDPDGNALVGPNGEADPVAMTQFANKYLPAIGQGVVQGIVKTQNDRLQLNDNVRTLDQNYRDALSGIVRSQINGDPSKIGPAIDQYVQEQGPNAPASLLKAAENAKSLVGNLGSHLPDDKNNAALLHLAQTLQPSATTTREQQPSMVDYTTESGNVGSRQVNPLSSVPMGPVGPEAKTGIAPTVVTPPGNVPQPYKGMGPVPSSYGGAAGPPPTEQEVTNFGTYQAGLNSRVQAGSNVLPQIQQLDRALASFKDVGGGTSTRAEIAKTLQSFGAPQSIVDAVGRGNLGEIQAAEKYLFQSTLDTLQQGGAGITDNRFAAAAAALPSIDTDPRAKASLIGFIQDRAQRDYAEQQALAKARIDKTLNPATWQADYQQKLRAGTVPGVPTSQIPTTEPAATKTVTQANVDAYAKKHNLTAAAARQHVLSQGFTIQ